MWKRLDESSLRNVGGIYAKLKRVYGENGEHWPRLTIALYEDAIYGGVKISVSRKDGPGGWWEECGAPVELLPDVAQMLTEYANGNVAVQ